jgi:hypothetical protein
MHQVEKGQISGQYFFCLFFAVVRKLAWLAVDQASGLSSI